MLSAVFARNPGVLTIEEDLIEALCKAEAFPEEMKDNLGKVRRQLQNFCVLNLVALSLSLSLSPDIASVPEVCSH